MYDSHKYSAAKGSPIIFVPTPRRTLVLVIFVFFVTTVLYTIASYLQPRHPIWLHPYEGHTGAELEQCKVLLQENGLLHKFPADATPSQSLEDEDMYGAIDEDKDYGNSDEGMDEYQTARKAAVVPGPCNPFKKPGWVDFNGQNLNWVPTLPSCKNDISYANRDQLFQHLQNKRFYFYGDSILRFAARDFCSAIGAEWTWHTTPPEYYWKHSNQGLHTCHLGTHNFTLVHVYTFGIKDWNMSDYPYLNQHVSIKNDTFIDPVKWAFEHRLLSTYETFAKEVGPADFIIMNSGLWDLPYMQKYMLEPARQIEQTVEPHPKYLDYYVTRMRGFINLARHLQRKPTRRIFWTGLHNPQFIPREKDFCQAGHPQELVDMVNVTCYHPERLQALRDTQLAVIEEEREAGRSDIDLLPYYRWVAGTDEKYRMRDDIHPSVKVNEMFTMALLREAKESDRLFGHVHGTPPPSSPPAPQGHDHVHAHVHQHTNPQAWIQHVPPPPSQGQQQQPPPPLQQQQQQSPGEAQPPAPAPVPVPPEHQDGQSWIQHVPPPPAPNVPAPQAAPDSTNVEAQQDTQRAQYDYAGQKKAR